MGTVESCREANLATYDVFAGTSSAAKRPTRSTGRALPVAAAPRILPQVDADDGFGIDVDHPAWRETIHLVFALLGPACTIPVQIIAHHHADRSDPGLGIVHQGVEIDITLCYLAIAIRVGAEEIHAKIAKIFLQSAGWPDVLSKSLLSGSGGFGLLRPGGNRHQARGSASQPGTNSVIFRCRFIRHFHQVTTAFNSRMWLSQVTT